MFYEMFNFRDRIRNSEVSNFIFCNISMLLIFGNYKVFTCTNFVSSGNVTYLLSIFFSIDSRFFFISTSRYIVRRATLYHRPTIVGQFVVIAVAGRHS